MRKILAFIVSAIAFASAHASNDWQFLSTGVNPSTSGTSYTVTATMVPSSSYTTYTVYVLDSMRPWDNTTMFGTTSTSVTFKDSSGNTVCNAPSNSSGSVSMSGVTGSLTMHTWTVSCNSGTLTNGNTYTVTITGKDYQVGAGSSGTSDSIAVWLGAS